MNVSRVSHVFLKAILVIVVLTLVFSQAGWEANRALADASNPPVITEGDSTSVSMSQNGAPNAFSLTLHASGTGTLTWSISSPAGHGTASAGGTGTSEVIGYAPAADYSGPDSFVVQVDDGSGGADTITVNVMVMQDGNPNIDVWFEGSMNTHGGNMIWGWGWPLGLPITVTIDDPSNGLGIDFSDTQLSQPRDDGGTIIQFNNDNLPGFITKAGELITMTNGLQNRTLSVPPLSVTEVDTAADTIAGTTLPGTQVRVTAEETERLVTADGNGNWIADFSVAGLPPSEHGLADIRPGSWDWVFQHDASGDQTRYEWRVPNPLIQAQIFQNKVEGQDWLVSTIVTLTIDNPANGVGVDFSNSMIVDENRLVRFNDLGGLTLAPGMLLSMADGHTTKTHSVTDLAVTGVDPALDTVSGTGTPATQVDVQYCDPSGCIYRRVTVQPDGAWQADFSVAGATSDEQRLLDILPGMQGKAFQGDEDNDQTQVNWRAGIPGWQLKSQGGFGNTNNLILATESFNDQLYAATANWTDGGAQVWRSTGGSQWTPASEMGMSATYGATNSAILDLVTFNGQLYAAVGWGANEGQIWRTANGTDWNKVTEQEFGGASKHTVTVMAVFSNTLYAAASGTTGTAEIWRSSSGDSGSWERVAQNSFGDPDNGMLSGAAVFEGALFVAVNNSVDGAQVWRSADGNVWTQSNLSGFGDAANVELGSMAVFAGNLYVGTQNATSGGQIWRFDGATWLQSVGDGFGSLDNSRIVSLYAVQNQLFAVTNDWHGLQIWRTTNSTDWAALNQTGLGDSNNVLWWANATSTFANSYIIGTQNGTSGGEVWQYIGDSPVITEGDSISVSLSEDGSPAAFDLTLHATDPDNDPLNWSISGPASHGTATAGGTGASKAIGYTPHTNYNGADSFVVQVGDGVVGTDTITVSITVNPVNDAPTLSPIGTQSTNEGTATNAIPFTVGDIETSAASLIVTASSSNPVLAPNGNIALGGSGANRTITLTPAANQKGTATITVSVNDGDAISSNSFVLIVNAVNHLPVINQVLPQQGLGSVPNEIYINGYNFGEGVIARLGTVDLQTLRFNSSQLRATVPPGLATGAYALTVIQSDGASATLANAYMVLSTAVDDLYGYAYELWSSPSPLRALQAQQIGLVVHRQGGQNPISNVVVRFFLGDPAAGGVPIGDGSIPHLSPRGAQTTSGVIWTPSAAGEYTLYAVIDPAGQFNETLESNNVVSRKVTVLPAVGDQVAPHVDSFVINDGASSISNLAVSLDTVASDNPGGSGVAALMFVQYQYSAAADLWAPVQNSGWLGYSVARANYVWNLMPAGGVIYLQAWARDRAGNISVSPGGAYVNYRPASESVAAGQVRIYRYSLNAGQTITVRVTPTSGDPDLYIWAPDYTTRRPWISNRSSGFEEISFSAPIAGVYQIEVYGFTAAQYSISVTLSAATQIQADKAWVSADKSTYTQPYVALESQPGSYYALPPGVETPDFRVYAPLVTR